MKQTDKIFVGAVALVLWTAGAVFAQGSGTEPIHLDPSLPWSERMALSEIYRHQQGTSPTFAKDKDWNYVVGLVLTSIEQVWHRTGKDIYYDYTKSFGDRMVRADGTIEDYDREEFNIDHINAGNVLFNLYDQTKDERYRTALDHVRSQLDDHPRVYQGGFWHKKIYTNQMWLDGLYMGAPLYAQYEMRWGQPEQFEDIARQFMVMERQARDPETGLLYHGWDCSREMFWADPITGLSSNFWGRAVGWYAMGLVDTLDFFPEEHPRRPELIAILNRLVDAMAQVQDPSGTWWQVLDQHDRAGNYLEATVTSMMTYSMLKGVRKGYLKAAHLEVAAKAWQGLFRNFVQVDDDDQEVHLVQCCAVAGLGGKNRRDGSYAYYINEPIRADDGKGTGPFIRACLEVETMADWLPQGREQFVIPPASKMSAGEDTITHVSASGIRP